MGFVVFDLHLGFEIFVYLDFDFFSFLGSLDVCIQGFWVSFDLDYQDIFQLGFVAALILDFLVCWDSIAFYHEFETLDLKVFLVF